MVNVAALWRHPIKSHGREALDSAYFEQGQTMPWDRHWAIAHEASKFDQTNPAWVMCRNFMIGASTPALAGIWAALEEPTRTLTLRHDRLGSHRFQPDNPDHLQGFIDWVSPLCPADQRQPKAIVAAPARGMTDTDYASVSLMTTASHAAVEAQLGHALETARWRGNIWLDGATAWQETDWIGSQLQIGDAILAVTDPIERCKHTMANPQTGVRDADTLSALRDGWGHQNFGVYATVIQSGKITLNDRVEVI